MNNGSALCITALRYLYICITLVYALSMFMFGKGSGDSCPPSGGDDSYPAGQCSVLAKPGKAAPTLAPRVTNIRCRVSASYSLSSLRVVDSSDHRITGDG
ncbi:hypothetical protein Tcan_15158 [Toxocara canis]|uniref:Uncharacterized protein n=1 Tax=Toxocara canis TaxID=6265 RepID=A0A0B2UYY5_TOXCA|nr:hypothetical protein Tcan_15158 [Toxocara canis]